LERWNSGLVTERRRFAWKAEKKQRKTGNRTRRRESGEWSSKVLARNCVRLLSRTLSKTGGRGGRRLPFNGRETLGKAPRLGHGSIIEKIRICKKGKAGRVRVIMEGRPNLRGEVEGCQKGRGEFTSLFTLGLLKIPLKQEKSRI